MGKRKRAETKVYNIDTQWQKGKEKCPFRMQTETPKLVDLGNESEATRKLYGIGEKTTDQFGRQCLLARRFAEAGVRFVQVSLGAGTITARLTRGFARNAPSATNPSLVSSPT